MIKVVECTSIEVHKSSKAVTWTTTRSLVKVMPDGSNEFYCWYILRKIYKILSIDATKELMLLFSKDKVKC